MKLCSKFFTPYLLSTLLGASVFLLSGITTVPWLDEIVLADKPTNWIMRGENYGYVCACTYNLLFPLVETLWFWLFGPSHASACALPLLFALLSSFAALHILTRRGILTTSAGQCLFIVLYWCGWNMIWIVTNGRPDTMAMFFTILLADALVPDPVATRRVSLFAPIAFAYLLLLTSPSTIPVLFIGGIVLLATADPVDRKQIFKAGVATAMGFGLAMATMLAYYCCTHEIVTFIGSYYQHNNATSANGIPFFSAILKAYQTDLSPFPLLLASAIIAAASQPRPTRRFWFALLFAALIPAMMAPSRYATYYAWTFHLPAAILLASVLDRSNRKVLLSFCIAISLPALACREYVNFKATAEKRALYASCQDLVNSYPEVFRPGADIVVTEDIDEQGCGFLYPVLNRGCRFWMRGKHILTIPCDEAHVRECLSAVIPDSATQERILAFQRFPPQLPESGTFLFVTPESRAKILPVLSEKGYQEVSAQTPANAYPCFSRWAKPSAPGD